jgi:hypothetical protein
MKFIQILSALSLVALALGAPEAHPEEKRQGACGLRLTNIQLGTSLVDFTQFFRVPLRLRAMLPLQVCHTGFSKHLSRIPDL